MKIRVETDAATADFNTVESAAAALAFADNPPARVALLVSDGDDVGEVVNAAGDLIARDLVPTVHADEWAPRYSFAHPTAKSGSDFEESPEKKHARLTSTLGVVLAGMDTPHPPEKDDDATAVA